MCVYPFVSMSSYPHTHVHTHKHTNIYLRTVTSTFSAQEKLAIFII